MKGSRITYSVEELDYIRSKRELPRKEAYALFREQFERADVSLSNFTALCKRKGWLTGRDGRLKPGNVPLNKGKRCPDGVGGRHPNSRKTQFRRGRLPHNTKYAGHERVSVDGYVEISVDETNPHTGFERRYVLKHLWLWENANGPLPEGQALKCLDGNRLNTDPSNWQAVPRAILPALNGRWGKHFNEYEPELRPTVIAVAQLRHVARSKRKAGA
ncbi:MAG: HNH endonuclease [Allorhizobium sp.]